MAATPAVHTRLLDDLLLRLERDGHTSPQAVMSPGVRACTEQEDMEVLFCRTVHLGTAGRYCITPCNTGMARVQEMSPYWEQQGHLLKGGGEVSVVCALQGRIIRCLISSKSADGDHTSILRPKEVEFGELSSSDPEAAAQLLRLGLLPAGAQQQLAGVLRQLDCLACRSLAAAAGAAGAAGTSPWEAGTFTGGCSRRIQHRSNSPASITAELVRIAALHPPGTQACLH
jgi:hypothetical protein